MSFVWKASCPFEGGGRRLRVSSACLSCQHQQCKACPGRGLFRSYCAPSNGGRIQVCVRSSHHLAWLCHEYLLRIPWKLCRLREPEVAKECIAQYDSGLLHCPLSHYLLSPDGPLRSHVKAVAAGGSVSDLLEEALRTFEAFPMDDSVCETPHAVGNAIARQSKHCAFSWVAASIRLKLNLQDVKTWRHAVRADIQSLWLRYASILQSDPRMQHRNVRIPRKQFIHRLYYMGLMSLPLRDAAADNGGASSSKDPIMDVAIDDPAADHDNDVASDSGDDARPGPDPLPVIIGAQDLALMRDFLLATLNPGMYVSVPVHSEEFPDQLDRSFMQILSIEPKVVLPPWFKSKGDKPKFLDLGVQRFEQHVQDPDASDSKAEVFVFSEPASLDWGQYCPDDRRKFLQWEAHPSSIDGWMSPPARLWTSGLCTDGVVEPWGLATPWTLMVRILSCPSCGGRAPRTL